MRKKTRRFIGALLAMVLAFLSIGEAVPAFAADELILSDENGEDILLTDADSPEDVTADVPGEDDTGLVDDANTYFNADSAPDASADNYADIAADTGEDGTVDIDTGIAADVDADTAANGDTQDGKEPNPVEDHYDVNGICYYNVNSNNIDSDKLFYEDLFNTRSEYLDGFSLGELWMMTAIGVIPDSQFAYGGQAGQNAKKEAVKYIKDSKNSGSAVIAGKYNTSTKKVEQLFENSVIPILPVPLSNTGIIVRYSNFKVSPLLPDASVSSNYVSTQSGERNTAGAKASEFTNNTTRDSTASVTESEGGSVSLSSTVNHSSSYSFEEGFEVGAEFDFICAKVSEKVSFKATQAVQNGWSKTNTNTQNYNNSRTVSVTVPAHSVLMLRNYTTDASVLTRYNCPVALTYDVEISWANLLEVLGGTKLSFGSNARTNLKHRAFEEGKKDGYDDQNIIWSQALSVDEIKRAIELITTHVPMSGTGAAFSENLKAEGFKIEGAVPLYKLEKIKLKAPGYSFIENKQVDYNNLQFYTANMKVGDYITPDSLELDGYDRDGVPYCKFNKGYGSWYIADENGNELTENTPVVLKKVAGQDRFEAVSTGSCYLIYRINEKTAGYNSYEAPDTYATNESLKSTAALKLVISDSRPDDPYKFEIKGSYSGRVGAPAENIEGDNKLSAVVRDSSDNQVEYKWKSVELKRNGIDLTEDGMVTFSKAGTYHVRVYVEKDGKSYESEPMEIIAESIPGITAPQAGKYTYDGTEKKLLLTPGEIEGDGGRIVYALGDDKDNEPSEEEFSEQIPTAVDAGDYKIWFKTVDGYGKELVKASNVTATINKARYEGETQLQITHDQEETSNSIDLRGFLPENTTGLAYGKPEVEGLSYKIEPVIDEDSHELSYTLNSSDAGENGSITISVSLANYEDYFITISIRRSLPFVKEPVSSVTLNEKKYNLGKGESVTLLATVLPVTAGQKLKWTADNTNVTIIPSPDTMSAYVTGEKAGSVKVTASATDSSNKKAVCSIKVGNPVGDFKISGKNGATDVPVGKSLAMAVAWDGDKPQNPDIVWEVDNEFIATISDKGVLKGKNEGKVKVFAISKVNHDLVRTTYITVYNPVKKVGLNVTKGVVSRSENAKGLSLSAYATGVTPSMVKNSATGVRLGVRPTVEFTTDEKYLKITPVEGDATTVMITPADGLGTVKNIPVRAKISAYKYEKILTCNVSIVDSNPLKKIKINKKKLSIDEGCIDDSLSVSLEPLNPDGVDKIEWASDNESIAKVDENGTVTAVKAGTAIISAKAGDKQVSCNVTVTPKVTKVTFTNKVTLSQNGLAVGKTFKMKTATELSGSGKSSSPLSWDSSDNSIATVDDKGRIKALRPGRVWIYAIANWDAAESGDMVYDMVGFNVYTPVKSLKLDKKKLELGTDEKNRYGKIAVIEIKPEDASDSSITWTTISPIVKLAAISEYDGPTEEAFEKAGDTVITGDGQVLAVKGLSSGKATITGVTNDGSNKKVTCTVIVK